MSPAIATTILGIIHGDVGAPHEFGWFEWFMAQFGNSDTRTNVGNAAVDIGGMSTLVLAPTKGAKLKVRNYASAVLLSRPLDLKSALEDSGRVVDAVP